MSEPLCVWFSELTRKDVPLAGGKGANLGDMVQAGLPVPPGFVITAPAYRLVVERANLVDKIHGLLLDQQGLRALVPEGTLKRGSEGQVRADARERSVETAWRCGRLDFCILPHRLMSPSRHLGHFADPIEHGPPHTVIRKGFEADAPAWIESVLGL